MIISWSSGLITESYICRLKLCNKSLVAFYNVKNIFLRAIIFYSLHVNQFSYNAYRHLLRNALQNVLWKFAGWFILFPLLQYVTSKIIIPFNFQGSSEILSTSRNYHLWAQQNCCRQKYLLFLLLLWHWWTTFVCNH